MRSRPFECARPGYAFRRHPGSFDPRCSSHRLRMWSSRSRRVPYESLDASEDLPKEDARQVTFGKLQDEVPGMPDEAPPGLEEPLLQTGQ